MIQSGIPRYLQIADQLRRDIASSTYPLGDRLPSEANLSHQLGVNRQTLRRAIKILRQEGLLQLRRGQGFFVTKIPGPPENEERLQLDQTLQILDQQVQRETCQINAMVAEAYLARKLGIASGSTVIFWESLYRLNQQPVGLTRSYLPSQLLPGFMDYCVGCVPLASLLQEHYDYQLVCSYSRIAARLPRSSEADSLQVSLNTPLLTTTVIHTNQQGQVVEYQKNYFRSDRTRVVFRQDP
jgi:DNA-binding GntR family transcriptional regulator